VPGSMVVAVTVAVALVLKSSAVIPQVVSRRMAPARSSWRTTIVRTGSLGVSARFRGGGCARAIGAVPPSPPAGSALHAASP
jgi:hypothetical protein